MKNEDLKELFKNTDNKILSRRDAIKLMGISPIAASVLASAGSGSFTDAEAVDVKGKIAIVGGGSGAIMTLARLHRAISNPDITIIAPNEIHLYQPGQVFVGAGLLTQQELQKSNKDFIPDDVTWIKDEAAAFDPDNNTLTTRGGQVVGYDYLIVAAGVVNHFDRIKGLKEEDIGTKGISSVYQSDLAKGTCKGAVDLNKWFDEVKEAAKKGKPKVVYTSPNTPIKCGGAPQKILYLSADYLKRDGLSADFIYTPNSSKLFGFDEINDSLLKVQKRYDTITNKFNHNLIEIDVKNKVATYEHNYTEKGAYDEEFDEYELIYKKETVKINYDFIHIVPPMSPPDAIMNSKLGWQKGDKGWLEVDMHTLQHRRYKNVFGIGDVCGIAYGKTGGTARHQAPIVVENLLAVMQNKEPKAKFDGYTVCPLKVEYGKVIMAEFNYDGLAPTFSFLKPEKPRWIWWVFDLYMLKPMYWHLMLRGWM